MADATPNPSGAASLYSHSPEAVEAAERDVVIPTDSDDDDGAAPEPNTVKQEGHLA